MLSIAEFVNGGRELIFARECHDLNPENGMVFEPKQTEPTERRLEPENFEAVVHALFIHNFFNLCSLRSLL